MRKNEATTRAKRNDGQLSLSQNMLWNSVGSMVYLACQWLITVAVVRLSSDYDAAGTLALAMAVSNVFYPIGMYKVRTFQVSDVKEAYTPGQYVAHRFFTLGISAVVMVVYAVATCSPVSLPAVFLYGVYTFGLIFVDVLHGVDQQKNRMDIIGKSFIARGVLSLGSFSAVLWLTSSLEAALLAMVVSTFCVIFLFDLRRTHAIEPRIKPDFSWGPVKSLLTTCFPAVVALFFCSAVPAIPRQVLEALYGTEALGVYASIASPVLIIQMGAQYIYAPLLGVFAEDFESKDARSFLLLIGKVTAGIAAVVVVGIAGFSLLGPWFFGLVFGQGIVEHLYLLNPLIVCTALTAYIWFIGDLLIVMRDTKGNLLAYLASFVACLATMYPAISAWGLNGTSFCVIISFAVGLAVSLARIVKTTRSFSRDSKAQDEG